MSNFKLQIINKLQITSIKLQINLKFQYPMTKTFNAVVSYRCPNFYPPVIMLFGTNAGGSSVWKFECRSLRFALRLCSGWWACRTIWSLCFGNRSQVQGSTFRVEDKEGIQDPKSSLKMLIFPNNCQFSSRLWIRSDEADGFLVNTRPKCSPGTRMQPWTPEPLNLWIFEPVNA